MITDHGYKRNSYTPPPHPGEPAVSQWFHWEGLSKNGLCPFFDLIPFFPARQGGGAGGGGKSRYKFTAVIAIFQALPE